MGLQRVRHNWVTFTVISWIFGEEDCLGGVSSSSRDTINMAYPCSCWPWQPGWISVCQVIPLPSYSFSPSPYCCIFWKEVTMCNSLFRNRKLHSISLRAELLMSIIWNSSVWEIGLLSHMYSVIYLYEYGPIDIHFILWGIIPKAELNLLHCSSCYSFDHWKLIPVFFDITPLFQVFFIF